METKTKTITYNLFQDIEENMELTEPNNFSDTDLSNIQSPTPTTSHMSSTTTRKRKKISQEKEFLNVATKTLLNYNSVNNHNLSTHVDDKFDAMGKKIAFDLRSLSPDQLIFAEKLMSDVIYYGKLNKLNEDAMVSIKPSQGFNISQYQTNNSRQYFTNSSNSVFQLHNTTETEPQQFPGLTEYLNFNKHQ